MSTEAPPAGPRPAVLTAAVTLVVAETVAQLVAIAARSELRVALRVALGLSVGLKLLFAWLLSRRSAGALLALVLWELTSLLVAVAASGWPVGVRVALALAAAAAIALLGLSARWIPSPAPPRVTGR